MRATTAISKQALAFLSTHWLRPSPQNYWLAFASLDSLHDELARTIAAMLDGGVRLKEVEADDLYERYFGRAASAGSVTANKAAADQLRHQTLRLADLTDSAAAVTGEFSRELAGQIPGLATASAAELGQLVATTLERARRSERELVTTAAEVEQLRQKLETVQGDAERDALTGLFNRRGIDAFLAEACGGGDPAVLAICDIDRSKSYNDRYGHGVGDRVLRTVAQTLAEALDGHMIGRWGGEEFLVVMRMPVTEGVAELERAKGILGDKHFKLRETDEPMGRITFSAGVVALPDSADGLGAALERADALLYATKHAGRDRVLAAADEASSTPSLDVARSRSPRRCCS